MNPLKFKPLELAAQAQNPDAFWRGASFGAKWMTDVATRKIADHIRENRTPNLPIDALIILDEVFSEVEKEFGDAAFPQRQTS